MARRIYCRPCGINSVKSREKFGEKYRRVDGLINRADCLCDDCGKPLSADELVTALTDHPRGPEVVVSWEHEYLQEIVGADEY